MIPVILPYAPIDVRVPTLVRAYTWIDCRENGFSDSVLDRLHWGITGDRPQPREESSGGLARVRLESYFAMEGGKIPFRRFRRGGAYHYKVKIGLAGDASVLDSVIEVEYDLHHTFKLPRRISTDRANNFCIEIWTYGEFDLSATVRFADGTALEREHYLELDLPDDDGTNYLDLS